MCGRATRGGAAVYATFTVTAASTLSSSLPVRVSVTDAPAGRIKQGQAAEVLTVTIASGAASAVLSVQLAADELDEPDGSVLATVLSGTGYAVGSPDAATVPVADDDDPPSLSVTAAHGAEQGSVAPRFTVGLSAMSGWTVTVDYTTADGTATAPADYATTMGTLTFAAYSALTQVISVPVEDDAMDEPDNETVVLELSNPSAAVTLPAGARTTSANIADNDEPPAITIAKGPDVTEADPGDSPVHATFTLTANPPPTGTLTVTVTVTDTPNGSWIAGSAPTTVTFAANAATAVLSVQVTADNDDEPNGRITATLASGTGYTGSGTATVNVADDDDPPPAPVPAITITKGPDVTEADPGDSPVHATFTLTANPPPTGTLTVTVTVTDTPNGSWIAGSAPTTVTFAANAATAVLSVQVTADNDDEPNGSITAAISSGTGYTGTGTATVNVADDDDPPPVPVPAITITKGPDVTEADPGDSAVHATFTLRANPAPNRHPHGNCNRNRHPQRQLDCGQCPHHSYIRRQRGHCRTQRPGYS